MAQGMTDAYYTVYNVLDVSETATQAEIKAAHRALIRQVHPDTLPQASAYWKRIAEEKTKELNRCCAVVAAKFHSMSEWRRGRDSTPALIPIDLR